MTLQYGCLYVVDLNPRFDNNPGKPDGYERPDRCLGSNQLIGISPAAPHPTA